MSVSQQGLTPHDATTVGRLGWGGTNDQELLNRAASAFHVFLTVDQSLEDQSTVPPELALITMVSRSIEIHALRPLIPDILRTLETIRPGDKLRLRT